MSREYVSLYYWADNRPSRGVDSTSDYTSLMQSTLPGNISMLGKLCCSPKSHVNMTICPELGRSGEASITLRPRMQELKASEGI